MTDGELEIATRGFMRNLRESDEAFGLKGSESDIEAESFRDLEEDVRRLAATSRLLPRPPDRTSRDRLAAEFLTIMFSEVWDFAEELISKLPESGRPDTPTLCVALRKWAEERGNG